MKNGFRVYDSDTHVNPAAEVLDKYVDPGFRPRLAELEAYRLPVGQGAVAGVGGTHNYRVGTKYYRRVPGGAGPARIEPQPVVDNRRLRSYDVQRVSAEGGEAI